MASSAGAQLPDLGPPPGRLIDIGGRNLHMICSGNGAPVVVLEAGASSFAIDWTLVQDEIAKSTRVCAYDRAGMGWSDTVPSGSRASSSDDLHALLRAAGERGPFVMVGASRGGLLVRRFALDHPEAVAGFVFVDPSTEDRLFTMLDGQAVPIASLTAEQLGRTFPTQDVRVPRRSPQRGSPFDRLPAPVYAMRIRLDERLIAGIPEWVPPEPIARFQEAERALLAGLLESRASRTPLGARPTVVLTRGDEPNAGREESHRALAKLSSNGRHSVIAGAGHEIHLFEPAAVIHAIADVVAAVRTGTPLTKP